MAKDYSDFGMAKASPKFLAGHGRYFHWCPGCEVLHPLPLDGWTFNGNMECPTFTPSFLQHPAGALHGRCHYIITDGILNFCDDSDHSLKGTSVPLPDLPQ